MTREQAVEKLNQLRDDTNAINPGEWPGGVRELKLIVFKLIDIYIADLQADDRNNGADDE